MAKIIKKDTRLSVFIRTNRPRCEYGADRFIAYNDDRGKNTPHGKSPTKPPEHPDKYQSAMNKGTIRQENRNYLTICKLSFQQQNRSFYKTKPALLPLKTSPFASQNLPFCRMKPALRQNRSRRYVRYRADMSFGFIIHITEKDTFIPNLP